MIYHDVPQGSAGWLELRAKHFNASEAPAMLGVSKYQSRDELLNLKYTGEAVPISPQLQALFDRGHAAEAAIRPYISELICDELFPVTGSIEVYGLALGASFDGLTMDESINFEHKLWNEDLAEQIRNNDLHEQYKWQMDQQMMVSGATRTIFVTSDGTPDRMKYYWYEADHDRFDRLIAGWKQFDEDLANYIYTPEPELIKAEAVLSLPAVSIEVSGSLAMISNLDEFGGALKDFIGRINKEPETDQDFANLEAAVKILKTAEDKLRSEENRALSQASDIDTMRRTVDLYWSIARDNRLIFDKLVKSQKEVIKSNVMLEARDALLKHIGVLNEGLGGPYVQYNADFKGVMKGRSKVSTLRSAANDELARAKIEANEAAEKYRTNLKRLNHAAAAYKFLFNDLADIINKEPADFVLLVDDRVTKYNEAEADKLEAEREKIRQEEKDKLEREEAARVMAENRKRAEVAAKAEQKRIYDEGVANDEILIAEEKAKRQKATQAEPLNELCHKNEQFDNSTWAGYVITVTDKHLFTQAVLAGLPNTDIDDLYINTDRLTEKAYQLNGNLSIPGIKVTDEKAA